MFFHSLGHLLYNYLEGEINFREFFTFAYKNYKWYSSQKRFRKLNPYFNNFVTQRNKSLAVKVSSVCNFKCSYCLRRYYKGVPNFSLALLDTVLGYFKGKDYKNVLVTGGEPILNPDFNRIISRVVNKGFYFGLITNGYSYKEYWPIVKKHRSKLLRIVFSLNGANSEIHNNVCGIESFNKVIEAIQFYTKHNIPIGVAVCLTKDNIHQIEDISILAQDFQVSFIKFVGALGKGGGNYYLSEEERKKVLMTVSKLKRKLMIPLYSDFSIQTTQSRDYYSCLNLSENPLYFVDPDGGIIFCPAIYKESNLKPNILKDGLENCLDMNRKIVSELKKQREQDINNNFRFENFDTCEFCNYYVNQKIEQIRNNSVSS